MGKNKAFWAFTDAGFSPSASGARTGAKRQSQMANVGQLCSGEKNVTGLGKIASSTGELPLNHDNNHTNTQRKQLSLFFHIPRTTSVPRAPIGQHRKFPVTRLAG